MDPKAQRRVRIYIKEGFRHITGESFRMVVCRWGMVKNGKNLLTSFSGVWQGGNLNGVEKGRIWKWDAGGGNVGISRGLQKTRSEQKCVFSCKMANKYVVRIGVGEGCLRRKGGVAMGSVSDLVPVICGDKHGRNLQKRDYILS